MELSALVGIGFAIAIGAASPGPSFIMVARVAVTASRADALCAALGMGVGGLLFAALALLGLHSLLQAVPQLYVALKVLGGLYLVYLGCRIWQGAEQSLSQGAIDESLTRTGMRSFVLALATQMSNPKAAIVYASVFAAFLPQAPSLTFSAAVAMLVFLIEFVWYAAVALTLSAERPRNVYLRLKTWIDRAAGSVMLLLGLRLVTSARA